MFTHSEFGAFTKHWWVLLVRGLVAVLFGIVAFQWPGPTLVALVFAYGAYAFVDGMTALWAGAFAGSGGLILSGVLGIAIGISTFFFPGITAVALFYLIAAWAIGRGIFEIIAAVKLRKEISGEWALVVGGILSIALGVLLVVYPLAGVVTLAAFIGAYSLMFGIAMIYLGIWARGLSRNLEPHHDAA